MNIFAYIFSKASMDQNRQPNKPIKYPVQAQDFGPISLFVRVKLKIESISGVIIRSNTCNYLRGRWFSSNE